MPSWLDFLLGGQQAPVFPTNPADPGVEMYRRAAQMAPGGMNYPLDQQLSSNVEDLRNRAGRYRFQEFGVDPAAAQSPIGQSLGTPQVEPSEAYKNLKQTLDLITRARTGSESERAMIDEYVQKLKSLNPNIPLSTPSMFMQSQQAPVFPQGQPPQPLPMRPMAVPPQFAMPPEAVAGPTREVLGGMGSALQGIGQGALNLAAFPGRAFQAGMAGTPYTTEQMVPWATEMATNMVGAGSPFAQAGALGSAGGKLAMDEASRMSRAASQGYTIDAYKGLYPYDWNTVPARTGMGKIIPGTENRIPQELTSINSPNAPYAGFFSNDPQVASRFAQGLGEGSVLPAKLKFEKPLVIDAEGQHAANFQFESVARQRGTLDQYNAFKEAFEGNKYDGVILKNTKDEGDVYVPRNPNQVRSRFAAFDPANIKSEHLLASLIGMLGGASAAPIFAPQQQGMPAMPGLNMAPVPRGPMESPYYPPVMGLGIRG